MLIKKNGRTRGYEMQIVYATKELATCAGDKSFAVKKLGQRRANIYWARLETLKQACDLDHPYRLIFKPLINNEGNIVGLIVEQTVSIMEIVDYHK